MAPKVLLQKALDYNARKFTSKMRVPFGTQFYGSQWLSGCKLDFNRMTLPVNHGRFSGRGIRLAQISDLHLGLYVGNDELKWLADSIEAHAPDVLIITGDFVNRSVEEAYSAFEGLRRLAEVAPTYGVLGNHDFWHGPDELAHLLTDSGMRILRNEHIETEINGNPMLIAGVDDWKTGHDDLETAVRDLPQGKHFRLLLSHCPDLLYPAANYDFDLVLAGHTHGAQVRLPVIGPAVNRMMHGEFDRGWSRSGETALYINRGLGAVFLPVRFKSNAEVTLLHLAAATAQQVA